MIRYLLGEMTIDEQVAMETGYFTDPEKFNLLQVVEQDLIEGYINNKLTAAGRAKFELHFLSTPARRDQVRFFQTLTKVLPFEVEQPLAETVGVAIPDSIDLGQKTSWWETMIAPFRINKLAVGMSFAAAILILAAAGMLMFIGDKRSSEGNLANLQTPEPSAGQVANQEQQKGPGLPDRGNPALANKEAKQANPHIAVPKAEKPAAKPVIASFVLAIPGVRGTLGKNTTAPQVLRIPLNAENVQLTFNHQDAPYSRYKVSLHNFTGKQLWSRSDVRFSRVKSGTSLILHVPAKQFNEGSYVLSVSRNNSEGDWVVFHEFYIEVVR